jgi:hypothetical protein
MKANKNIKTAPTSGSTMGINGTTASTASSGWCSAWLEGADMCFFQWSQVNSHGFYLQAAQIYIGLIVVAMM